MEGGNGKINMQISCHIRAGTTLNFSKPSLHDQTSCHFQSKFTALSLAFNTDKLTLNDRLELQQRQRDTAEKNIDEDIRQLKTAIGVSE